VRAGFLDSLFGTGNEKGEDGQKQKKVGKIKRGTKTVAFCGTCKNKGGAIRSFRFHLNATCHAPTGRPAACHAYTGRPATCHAPANRSAICHAPTGRPEPDLQKQGQGFSLVPSSPELNQAPVEG